jgi:serine/threonine protein kinase
LCEEIGRGGIGVVYACRGSGGSDCDVAIKVMTPSPMVDSAIFDGIVDAALATRSLAGRVAVVPVFDAGRIDTGYYHITMRRMVGGTMERFIGDGDLDFRGKLLLAAGIAKALDGIHAAGIAHGDLKPQNVLLSKEGRPFLNDFYLVPRFGTGAEISSMGTPYYMSPEQAAGRPVNPASDMYSFGVLLYELLSGEMPYARKPKNLSDMMRMVENGEAVPLGARRSESVPGLEKLLSRLLSKVPDERPPRGLEVADALAGMAKSWNGNGGMLGFLKRLFR